MMVQVVTVLNSGTQNWNTILNEQAKTQGGEAGVELYKLYLEFFCP
jgi:hypothetical protein